MKSLFISFEGADACGKSTQVQLLAETLRTQGRELIITREPGGTKVAEKIRDILLDKELQISARGELLLYLAARAEHVQQVIKPALQAGKIVICDRFLDSTLVYQGLARGLGLTEVLRLNEFATQGLLPQVTFWLAATREVLETRRLRRGAPQDRLELEQESFKELVRQGFAQLQELYPARIKKIDASQEISAVQAAIWHNLQEYI